MNVGDDCVIRVAFFDGGGNDSVIVVTNVHVTSLEHNEACAVGERFDFFRTVFVIGGC